MFTRTRGSTPTGRVSPRSVTRCHASGDRPAAEQASPVANTPAAVGGSAVSSASTVSNTSPAAIGAPRGALFVAVRAVAVVHDHHELEGRRGPRRSVG